MKTEPAIRPSEALKHVRYEIRGRLARRALELERQGYEIISLNIGNPRAFGFRTPETMRLAMIENLGQAEGYCHQKGIFPAREAVVMQQQERGVEGVTAEEVFIGNGVSELIDLTLRALLSDGDEVLVPSPDYPLWTAAVTLNRGRAVHYPCRPEQGFVPDPAEIGRLITPRTRALVVINPNNPTGAVYPRAVLEALARLAERHGLVVFSDEIYDQMTYEGAEFVPMATLVHDTLCATLSGLSKVYRACGYRAGWAVFSGRVHAAADYLNALELLASLRLCSNVMAQWAVQYLLEHPENAHDGEPVQHKIACPFIPRSSHSWPEASTFRISSTHSGSPAAARHWRHWGPQSKPLRWVSMFAAMLSSRSRIGDVALTSRAATEMIPLRYINFRMPLTVSSRDGSALPQTEASRAI